MTTISSVLAASGIPLVILSCSTDGIRPDHPKELGAIEGESELIGPPKWPVRGESGRIKEEPEIAAIDPRVLQFRKQSPVKFGSLASPRLARFLFYHREVPGRKIEESVAEVFSLPLEAARLATDATFAQATAWHGALDNEDVGATYADAERAYWNAIELAPRAWVIYEGLGELYSSSPNRCDLDGLERLGDRWGDRREAMLRLAPIVIGNDECKNVLQALAREYPDDLDVLGLLARQFDSSWNEVGFGIAIRRYALDLATERGAPEGLRTTIQRGLIHALLSSGQTVRGIAQWEGISADQQARLLEGPTDFETVFPSGFRGIDGPIDQALALELAAAYVVSGHDAHARALIPSSRPKNDLSERHLMYGQSTPYTCDRLLRVALGEAVEDPFEYLLTLAGAGEHFGEASGTCNHNESWIELERRIAREAGYPIFEAEFENDSVKPFASSSFDYFEEHDAGFLDAASPSLRDRYARLRDELEVQDEPKQAADLSTRTQSLVDARFDSGFVESRTSEKVPSEPMSAAAARLLKAVKKNYIDEAGDVVRLARQSDVMVRVHLNQDVDPMGEVSGGGYWLSFSLDGGGSWTRRFYTGLRAHFPYVVADENAIPIISGDTVRIAAAADEIDTSTISFPPIGLGSKRQESGLLLTIPLERLIRDSDGDGLTDLLESALLLAPDDPDSDRDGLPDAMDSLPRTPYRPEETSARSEALVAAIPHLFGSGRHAHVVAPVTASDLDNEDIIERAMGSAVGEGSERTLFVTGDSRDFSSLSVGGRVIVLSRAESAAMHERIGVFYPISIGLFVLDHEERRGYLRWGGGWTGGALGLKHSFGRWTADVLSHWMT